MIQLPSALLHVPVVPASHISIGPTGQVNSIRPRSLLASTRFPQATRSRSVAHCLANRAVQPAWRLPEPAAQTRVRTRNYSALHVKVGASPVRYTIHSDLIRTTYTSRDREHPSADAAVVSSVKHICQQPCCTHGQSLKFNWISGASSLRTRASTRCTWSPGSPCPRPPL